MNEASYAPGSLVRARQRDWVVLPESRDHQLILRPIGGRQEEITGVHTELELVKPAQFPPPDPEHAGTFLQGRLLRDAVRLGFRSTAGPFRSFARIAVEPRSYQLVPLLMAMELDPVRLLIADDVGIGKTVEALLIARELLDRGEIQRIAVLAPPHLVHQWMREMRTKFHLEAEAVLPSTVARLERGLGIGESLFERYPFQVISIDFIKGQRRKDEFLRTAPKFIIVDEAHTCAPVGAGRHLRYNLVRALADDTSRHMVLVTATPHSGKEDAFRMLLGLLDKDFIHLPGELSGPGGRLWREQLARHFIQRQRGDVEHYLSEDTPFPRRLVRDEAYQLDQTYRAFIEEIVERTRQVVQDDPGKHRLMWWSMLSLLRSVGSSPAAAISTLKERADSKTPADRETSSDDPDLLREYVMDVEIEDAEETPDYTPVIEGGTLRQWFRHLADRLASFAEKPSRDKKLQGSIKHIGHLIEEGYQPIVFCRFIDTAKYVANHLRRALKNTHVEAVTGELPPEERQRIIEEMGAHDRRVLVATDCLSEGIDLQQHFNAVLHYDLAWNPMRHEQREGRVDRYGQTSRQVRCIRYFGENNPIDGIVLEVLYKKHERIRSQLGISVPFPQNTEAVTEAILEGLILRGRQDIPQQLVLSEEWFKIEDRKLEEAWRTLAEREKKTRSIFAAHRIKPEVVRNYYQMAQAAMGDRKVVERLFRDVLTALGAKLTSRRGVLEFRLPESAPPALLDAMDVEPEQTYRVRFELPVGEQEIYLHRTHPIIEALASFVLETALEEPEKSPAARCGVMRTSRVGLRLPLLLLRLRFKLTQGNHLDLVEDLAIVAIDAEKIRDGQDLLEVPPQGNVPVPLAQRLLREELTSLPGFMDRLNRLAEQRAAEILEQHREVRKAARARYGDLSVDSVPRPDVLGLFLLMPVLNV
ncbi:helicase-related protein [Rhodocaloribacter sp.]